MDTLTLKIILVCVMMALTLAFGLLPVKLLRFLRKRANYDATNQYWSSLILCLLSCVTGGVFLATCFLHLLPEVREHLERIKDTIDFHTHYPLPELICCLGFFLVFFVEELTLLILQKMGHDVHDHHGNSAGHVHVPHPSTPEELSGILAVSDNGQNGHLSAHAYSIRQKQGRFSLPQKLSTTPRCTENQNHHPPDSNATPSSHLLSDNTVDTQLLPCTDATLVDHKSNGRSLNGDGNREILETKCSAMSCGA